MPWKRALTWLGQQAISLLVFTFLVCGLAVGYMLFRSDERW